MEQKKSKILEYDTPSLETYFYRISVLCSSTGVEGETIIEDEPLNW